MNFILKVLITGLIAYLLQNILSGVRIADMKTAALFALVLALFNAVVKPILVILTIPVTVFTLGLFLLVINAFFYRSGGRWLLVGISLQYFIINGIFNTLFVGWRKERIVSFCIEEERCMFFLKFL